MPETQPPHSENGAARPETSALRAREQALLVDLLAGKSLKEAAARIGISTRQAQRVRAGEAFQKAYSQAKTELLSGAIAALHANAMTFVDTLRDVALDSKCRGHERVSASREGINALYKGVELHEIEARLRRLEELAGGEK